MTSLEPAAKWEASSIRTWLNNEFFNTVFNDIEKNSINETKTGTTIDNVVLFSLEDVINPEFKFNTFKEDIFDYYYTSEALHRNCTDYSSTLDIDSIFLNRWFLRKVTGNLHRPAVVYGKKMPEFALGVINPDTGELESVMGTFCAIDYFDNVRASDKYGICPAIHIDLDTFDKIPVQVFGDIDGDNTISSSDARLVLRASVGLETFTEEIKALADVDKDGTVSSFDARLILRASVGLEDPTEW